MAGIGEGGIMDGSDEDQTEPKRGYGNLPIPGPGRPSGYDPAMNEVARKLCLLGLTDEELAQFFDISVRTLHRWKDEFPAFSHSINEGKVAADAEVADSLYKRATGQQVFFEKAVKTPRGEYTVLKLSQYVPGDVTAQRLWLLNRRKGNWRDKVDLTSTDGSMSPRASKEQRDAAVAAFERMGKNGG